MHLSTYARLEPLCVYNAMFTSKFCYIADPLKNPSTCGRATSPANYVHIESCFQVVFE